MPDPETVARYERAWKRMRRIRVALLFAPVPFYGGFFLVHVLSPSGGFAVETALVLLPTFGWCLYWYHRLAQVPCPRCGESFAFLQPYFSGTARSAG